MFKQSLTILFILVIVIFSCKENVVENIVDEETPIQSGVKLLHPNGGEKLISGETDTIRWSNPESIERIDLYYTLDSGNNWISLTYKKEIISGEFIWTIPDAFTNEAKIRARTYLNGNSIDVESDTVFQISRRLDVLTPTTLYGLELDTLKFIPNYKYNSLEFYYATSEGYSSWNDVEWVKIESNCTFPDSTLVWNVPNQGGQYKIKVNASFADKLTTYYTSEFQVNQKNITISSPKKNDIFNYPQNTLVEWESLSKVPEKIELYYSKFNLGKTSSWILIDDKISPTSNSFNWEIPSIYTNEVKLKVAFIYPDSNIAYGFSDEVFTIYDDNILIEEKQYQEKYGVGNKWVYLETEDFVWSDEEQYYSVSEVIGDKIENGIKYYEVEKKIIKDSITTNYSWVTDREYFSPTFILQNESYTENGWRYYFTSCYDKDETVFSIQQKIKEYYWEVAESGNAKSKYKRGKDIGVFYYYYMSEGNMSQKDLVGAYIDGVLYGDTTVVR